MPVRPYKRTKRQAIPRVDLQARCVTQTIDAIGDNTETYQEFTLKTCTVQPSTGEELEALEEGYRDRETFTIYSDTPARGVLEGGQGKPDEVFLTDRYTQQADWFIVYRSKPWRNSVISHYQLLVVKRID